MLDNVLSEIVNEVAFEGDQGCTFDQLFQHVETLVKKSLSLTKLIKPIQFDDNYKTYIWSQLRHNDQLLFTENGIAFDPSDMPYKALKCKSHDISVKSTREAQDLCIYGSLKTEKLNLSDKHKQVLNLVAKSRSQGISQYHLGEALNMDPRAIFYYLKKLEQLGIIVKEEAYISGMNTRVIMLKRFADSKPTETNSTETKNHQESNVLYRLADFKENVLKQLRAAKDHTLLLLDLLNSLGLETKTQIKWARVRLTDLHDQGIIEKFNAVDGKRKRLCVRLPCTKSEQIQVSAHTLQAKDKEAHTKKQYTISRDLPIGYIFYQDVVAAGEKGILRQDLIDKYPFIDPAQSSIFFDNATIPADDQKLSKYLIYRTEELRGKSRQFRFFSLDGWQAFCRKNGMAFADPEPNKPKKREELVEPKSIDEIGALFRGHLPSKRKKMEANEAEPKKRLKTLPMEDPVLKVTNYTHQVSVVPVTGSSTEEVASNKRNVDQLDGSTCNNELSRLPATSPYALKKTKKTQCHDNTKTRRGTILSDILENDHIREHNIELFKQFQGIEQATSGGQNIARKTFNRLVQQLHDQQKLRLYSSSVETPFGLKEIKTFILHPSLTGESDEVKQFIRNYNNEMPIMVEAPKRKTLKKVEVDAPLPPLYPPKTIAEKQANLDTSNVQQGIWHFSATEYGYLNSKWLRAKEFHIALFEYYKNNGENPTVDMGDFLKRMSLRTLMRFFGILPYNDEVLLNYLKNDHNRDTAMQDLPEQIKAIIIKVTPKIRRVSLRIINILRALELLEPATDADLERAGLSLFVTLRLTGLVKDYAVKERTLLDTIPLNGIDDVRLFWLDLQSYCSQLHDKLTATNDESDPLARIATNRGWSSNTLLTSEQKAVLNSFVDFEAQTVPAEEDRALRAHLVRKTGLTLGRIKTYYNAIMVAFNKYKARSSRARKRLEKELHGSSSPTVNELMKASLEKRKISAALFKMKQAPPFIEPTFIGSRKVRRLRLLHEPYQGQDRKHGRLVRHVSDPFSRVEKDVLLHAYSIMKARADELNFFWQPISQVITNHTVERCRRVLCQMLNNDPNLSKTIDVLKSKWIAVYEQGIARKEIKDEQPWNTSNYDLPSYLEYFIKQLQHEESELSRAQIVLPATYKELQINFHILHEEGHISNLNASPKGDHLHVYKESAYDTIAAIPIFDENLVSVKLVRTLIKMMLMTPDENYCPRATYSLFKHFSDTIIEKALEDLKLEGLIVQDRASLGRIPGRSINVSEKFLKFASGILPFGLFAKAKEFYNDITDQKTFRFISSGISSGVMAAALDLISQRKVSIDLVDRKAFIKSKKVLFYPRASAVTLREAFVFKNLDLMLKKEEPVEAVDDMARIQVSQNQLVVSTPTVDPIHKYLSSLEPFDKSVYEIIHTFEKRGASWSDIVEKLNVVDESYSKHDLSNTLQRLLSFKPALIIAVGFTHLRYVTAEFSLAWMLQTRSGTTVIPPLMWYDASGQVIQQALEGYANTVMSYILTQPGITFAHLREKVQGYFTEFELHHLLKYLIDSKKVISKKVQREAQPKRISIFDKRPIISVTYGEGVNNDQISHYWLSPSYYT